MAWADYILLDVPNNSKIPKEVVPFDQGMLAFSYGMPQPLNTNEYGALEKKSTYLSLIEN